MKNTTKKILSMLLAVIMLITVAPLSSFAFGNVVATGDCSAEGSSVTWTYYDDNTMVISGKGEMIEDNEYRYRWNTYKIEKVIVEEGITYIAEGAFSESFKDFTGLQGLKTVSLPDSLERIGTNAFYSCIYLEKIKIPDNVTYMGSQVFAHCKNLKEVTLSKNLKIINSQTFYDCTSLTEINIPYSIEQIADNAFAGCKNLSTVTLPDKGIIIGRNIFLDTAITENEENYENGVLYIGNHIISTNKNIPINYTVKPGTKSVAAYAFSESLDELEYEYDRDEDISYINVNLVDSIECIGNSAFMSEGGAISLHYWILRLSHLPKNIRHIGMKAFQYSKFVNSDIVIPSVIETVSDYAFAYCNPESVVISEGVKDIGIQAFWGHFDSEINIPASVETIGKGALVGADLNNIYVSEENKNYKDVDGVLYSKDGTKLLVYPLGKTAETYAIPDGTKTLASYAFIGRGAAGKPEILKTVIVPSSIIYVESDAFTHNYYEGWIEDDNYEDGGYYVTSGLENVIFETGERSLILENGAFTECYKLSNLVIPEERVYAISVHSIEETAFYHNSSNWENGALYLGTILLEIDPENVTENFTVREGTTVIADWANCTDSSKNKSIINTLPDSVVIIGSYNGITCTDLPSELKRIGTSGLSFSGDELEKALIEKYGENLEKIDINDTKLYEILTFNYVYDGWLIYNMSLGGLSILDELYFVEEGIIGLADGSYFTTGDYMSVALAKGNILPQTLKTLGKLNPFRSTTYYLFDEDSEISVTFNNSDCDIFDSEETIYVSYTICGYPDSTAEAYAKKYNRKFVDISNCTHELTCRRGIMEPTCENKGYAGDIYCQYCGQFMSEGNSVELKEHSFSEWETAIVSNCTEDGLETRKCTVCSFEETNTIPATGHTWERNGSYKVWYTYSSTCTTDKRQIIRCYNCSETKEIVYENTATGHYDNDNDGYCDSCDELLDATKSCGCNCHKTGFTNFIWKIILILQKIFKINRVCACGVYHY